MELRRFALKKLRLSGVLLSMIICIFFVLAGILLKSCKQTDRLRSVDDSDVKVERPVIKRYEQALFALPDSGLKEGLIQIKDQFQVFLDADLSDTINLMKIRDFISDPMFRQLYNDVNKTFPDVKFLEKGLQKGFTYLKYYYPETPDQYVYSYVSGLDYEQPVKLLDNSLIIALDMYLGQSYPAYAALRLPQFKTYWMEPSYILTDCFREYARKHIAPFKPSTILDYLMYEGKFVYFIDAMLPEENDTLKLHYTGSQLKWAYENEMNVWTFFVENQLLYSTQTGIIKNFTADAPFTSQFTKKSPGRILWFLGHQIVRSYMENNPDVSLDELMKETDSKKILSASYYKPGRVKLKD